METARLLACARCGEVFLVCGWVNRRYCTAECAKVAEQASRRASRQAYRRSPEGREQHRDEERRRRERRRGVGDAIVKLAAAAPIVAVMTPRVSTGLVQWRVVVSAALAEAAEELQRSRAVVACAHCGQRGRVVEVAVRRHDQRPAPRGARHQRGDDGA